MKSVGLDCCGCSKLVFKSPTSPKIKELLAKKINVNARNAHGVLPLQLCMKVGFVRPVPFLLDAGADPTICDARGRTALSAAIDYCNHLKNNTMLNHFLLWAGRHGDVDMLVTLLDYGANVDTIDEEGKSALQHAVNEHHIQAIEALLAYNMTKLRKMKEAFRN